MREIKFRAFDIDTRKMYASEYVNNLKEWRERPNILMQFTGLHDKNGKEIYEGDILLNNDERWEVNYKEGFWHLRHDNGENVHILLNENQHSEVIGNIYETPEFLSTPS